MPPRHWRTKAKAARVRGRTVRRRRSLEEIEDDGVERSNDCWWLLAIFSKHTNREREREREREKSSFSLRS